MCQNEMALLSSTSCLQAVPEDSRGWVVFHELVGALVVVCLVTIIAVCGMPTVRLVVYTRQS
jgi:hypothetical protein